jgi:hypothetical protein
LRKDPVKLAQLRQIIDSALTAYQHGEKINYIPNAAAFAGLLSQSKK